MYCSNCGKEIADNSKFCQNCGCPISEKEKQQIVPTANASNATPQTERDITRKKRTFIPFVVIGAVALIAIVVLAIIIGGAGDRETPSDNASVLAQDSPLGIAKDILEGGTTDYVFKEYSDVESTEYELVLKRSFYEIDGYYEICHNDGEIWRVIYRWDDKNDFNVDRVVKSICGDLGDYDEFDDEWECYTWKSNGLEVQFYAEQGIWIDLISQYADDNEIKEDNTEKLSLSSKSFDSQYESLKTILLSNSNYVLDAVSDSTLTDTGNININGYFCDVGGIYEVLCWEERVYQISFKWNDSTDIDMDDIVEEVNSFLEKYVRNYEYWGIYEWEKDEIKVSVDPEDGVCIEKVFDGGESELTIDTASVDRSIYMSLSEEKVDYDIGIVKTIMSYIDKPKCAIYEKYPNLIDDDWNRLLMAGTMFGIEGRYCIMYDRDTGLITGVGFDWIPDDRETHDNHIVYCVELYFGECTETDQFYYDKTYYEHDWDRTTIDNWSVHLSTTKDSGWLQFSQLAAYVPDGNLPGERSEANDYNEFVDVITECFKYIPDCDLSFGSEDTGSSNSFAIHAGNSIIGIFGIELDNYDMISMIDPDKSNADLHHEQMAIAMIMCLDSDMSYEEAKEIFEASKGDSASFGAGIYCFEGMDSGMKAFGIDITWLS